MLKRRVAEFRTSLPTSAKLHYAMKANPMPAVVCQMASVVDGIDVASGSELKVALDAGADPREISFAGPGKQTGELLQAVAASILINVESFREVAELAKIDREAGYPARVAVRIHPDFELKSSGMKMGAAPNSLAWTPSRCPSCWPKSGARDSPITGKTVGNSVRRLAVLGAGLKFWRTLELDTRVLGRVLN